MITTIITAILTSKAAQALGTVLVALVAWFGNGALQRRRGARERQAKIDAATAKDEAADLERMANVPILDAERSREWLQSRNPNTK